MAILEKSDDVEKTNDIYDEQIKKWRFWGAAYEGDQTFIDQVVKQHERESPGNWELRKEEAEVFNYSETIVNTFSRFLSMSTADRVLGSLAKDASFAQFKNDTDLYGTDYDIFWGNSSELAGVYGFCGVLVDKPPGESDVQRSQEDEVKNKIYPYYAAYIPENIYDWTWKRDPKTARPELVYLKLKESDTSFLIWTKEEWERWTKEDADDSEWVRTFEGVNKLKIIPFVWYTNYAVPSRPFLSLSDIRAVSRLQAALTRDLSHGNEVIKYAAFPMMRKPMLPRAAEPSDEDDAVGVTAIQEFDPENPNSKPDWMEAEVGEPIKAILDWDERKIEEIYRTASLSTFYGQHQEARSGVALRFEFQQLTAVVKGKASSLDDAETQALRLWRAWQAMPADEALDVTRPNNFNIDELKLQLENLLISKTAVRSELFKKAVEKRVVRVVLDNTSDQELAAIETEIDNTKTPTVSDFTGDEGDE